MILLLKKSIQELRVGWVGLLFTLEQYSVNSQYHILKVRISFRKLKETLQVLKKPS